MATAVLTRDDTFRKGEKVVAAVDFPGIPEGTRGKVTFVAGFDWIRYWVRFENGQTKGSINRKKLARPAEWDDILERRARGEDVADGGTGATDGAAAAAAGPADDGGAPTAGGAAGRVPEYLLERSRARREVLGKPLP
jgi:hypothetical protein